MNYKFIGGTTRGPEISQSVQTYFLGLFTLGNIYEKVQDLEHPLPDMPEAEMRLENGITAAVLLDWFEEVED
jgi:hypothetical protein